MSRTWRDVADELATAMERSSSDGGSGFCTLTDREHAALGSYQQMRRAGRMWVRSMVGFSERLDAFVHRHRNPA